MKTIIEMAREAGGYFAELPKGDAWLFDKEEQLEAFAALVAAAEREEIYAEWHSCVMSDLENGVKCLNEKAAADWHKNYPAQSKMFPEWIEARGSK
jgi:hypothetical protein